MLLMLMSGSPEFGGGLRSRIQQSLIELARQANDPGVSTVDDGDDEQLPIGGA